MSHENNNRGEIKGEGYKKTNWQPPDNPIIAQRFKAKMERYDKQAFSILVSWAINNASNFIPSNLKGTEEGFKLIQEWYPKFIEEYRNWMLDNMPIKEELKFVERKEVGGQGKTWELEKELPTIKVE